jgi:hypothetical protein
MFKVGYMDELQPIDRAIAELLAKREQCAQGKMFVPPRSLVEGWAKEFGMDPALLFWTFRHFTPRRRVNGPVDLGELQGIVPLMQRKTVNGCTYTLTHVEQFLNGSIVNLIASLETPEAAQVSRLELHLTLAIKTERYQVMPYGTQGGGAQLTARFLVTPPLPTDMGKVEFALVPDAGEGGRPPMIVRELDDPVVF